MKHDQIYQVIQLDSRYQENLDWGKPRKGHPEATLRAHIKELERNLAALRSRVDEESYWKLKVLIHVHDTFKPDAKDGVPIQNPRSHASLARAFLAEYCDDSDLLAMVQHHDEPYALWLAYQHRGEISEARLERLLAAIKDWNLFIAFLIIDGCTDGKNREPLFWFFDTIRERVTSCWEVDDLL